ncbi:hypothetical protein [Parasitella parasitica]|uniref:Uncharacterized protein n=1 Tax=Parasitella parasitica TaxID=35722 RepID=A0A0B7NGF2_9FUNG|nr:hypothetical protein [Parasitella parasitica]
MSLFSKLSKSSEKTLYPWSQKKLGGSNSALPRFGHAAAAISADAIVIYGGIHQTSTKKELFYIDTNSLSATSINAAGDVPSSRTSAAIVAMNNHVMLFGGRPIVHEEQYDGGFYILNLKSKQWNRIQLEGNQPSVRWGHSAVASDGIMYIWGGQVEGNYFNDLFIFNSSTFNSVPRWEQINYNNECPEPRSGHVSTIYENKLYIFGGTDGQRLFNDIWSFDLYTQLWLKIEADGYLPTGRESCASAMADDVIYIIGGKSENGIELNDLCAFKIKSRRWFRFQNMGPSPSPRHALTMTAVNHRLIVLGGDNETSKMDDSSLIYILDSSKIKYPIDTPQQKQSIESTNSERMYQQQQQQQYDSTSIESMNGHTHSYPQQQQYQQQQLGSYSPQQQQQQQQQGSYSPQQQQYHTQKPLPEQRQTQRINPPGSPMQQQQTRSLVNTVTNANGTHKEVDVPVNHSDVQPSPTNSSSISATSRHRSFYTDQTNGQPPVRPPRHISTVPEAALRRPRAASPLQQFDSEMASTTRRQYQSNVSPASPTSPESIEHVMLRNSLSQTNILAATEEQGSASQQQQRIIAQQSATYSSSNGPLAPPPRPPREDVGLGNTQNNTMMTQGNPGESSTNRSTTEHEEAYRHKSQMSCGNQPATVNYQQNLIDAQKQQQQQQQPVAHPSPVPSQQDRPIPERSPSHQITANGSCSYPNKSQQDHTLLQQDHAAAIQAANEERQALLTEIQTRDTIISEMRKKENWWRTEVSLARKQRSKNESFDDGPDADEALLMDMDHLSDDKVKVFEQLVAVKSELRRVRNSILQQAQPMSDKVGQADRMRTAALQEAAYFKSKYLALKARRQDDLKDLELDRCDMLEKRLAAVLIENEANGKLLQQLQKKSQHDQAARKATEERAHEAQLRAEEAQQAHQRALEELQIVFARATKAEVQVRDNAVKIADLTQQLSEALTSQPDVKSQDVTEAQLKASQLEAANLKARNETATLKQKLAENMDDIARLRTLLLEREDSLAEAKTHVEDCEIQLGMMREAMNQQHQQQQPQNASSTVNSAGFAQTRAY